MMFLFRRPDPEREGLPLDEWERAMIKTWREMVLDGYESLLTPDLAIRNRRGDGSSPTSTVKQSTGMRTVPKRIPRCFGLIDDDPLLGTVYH